MASGQKKRNGALAFLLVATIVLSAHRAYSQSTMIAPVAIADATLRCLPSQCFIGAGPDIQIPYTQGTGCTCIPNGQPGVVGDSLCVGGEHAFDFDTYKTYYEDTDCENREPLVWDPVAVKLEITLNGEIIDYGQWVPANSVTISSLTGGFCMTAPGYWRWKIYAANAVGADGEPCPTGEVGEWCEDTSETFTGSAMMGDEEFVTLSNPTLKADGESTSTATLENALSDDIQWKGFGSSRVATVDSSGTVTAGDQSGKIIVRANRGERAPGCGDGKIIERPIWVEPEDDDSCSDCSGGNCGIGSGEVSMGSVDISFRLGKDSSGEDLGRLWIYSPTVFPGLATPRTLHFDEQQYQDVEVVKDYIWLRQIVAPEVFVDIVAISNDPFEPAYVIRFYDPAQKGPWAENAGAYEVIGSPNTQWTLSFSNNALFVCEASYADVAQGSFGSIRKVFSFEDASQGVSYGTSMVKYEWGEGLCKEKATVTVTEDAGIVYETHDFIRYGGTSFADIVYARTEVYEHKAVGMRLIKTAEGAMDGNEEYPVETTYAYDSAGRLKSLKRSDGYWEWYDYDTSSRMITKLEPWGDQAYPQSGDPVAASSKATYYDYTSVDPYDPGGVYRHSKPRRVDVQILGISTSRTYYAYQTGMGQTGSLDVEVVARCVDPTATYTDSTNLVSETAYLMGDPDALAYIRHSDGRYDRYIISYGTYSDGGGDPSAAGFTGGGGAAKRTEITYTTGPFSDGIAYKSTRSVSIEDEYERNVMDETYVYTGSGFERIAKTVRYYDANDHLTDVYRSDGASGSEWTQEHTEWDCCFPLWRTDIDGTVTDFDYSVDGKLRWEKKLGVDAEGDYASQAAVKTSYFTDYREGLQRDVTRTVDYGDGGATTITIETERFLDSAGRIAKTVDNAGVAVSYAYDVTAEGGRSVSVSRQASELSTTTYYCDGQIKSVTGNGVVSQFYEYGVDADGKQWTKVYTGSETSPRWQKTWYDALGRKVKTEKPGFTTGSKVRMVYSYDDLGRLVMVAPSDVVGAILLTGGTPSVGGGTLGGIGGVGEIGGIAPTLYEYGDLGSLFRTGKDEDNSGTLDVASSDPITETEDCYEQDTSGNWWYKSTTKVYPTADSSSTRTVNTTMRQLTGLPTGVTEVTKTIDQNGLETISTTAVDREDQLVTETIDVPNSDVDAVTVIRNGLVQSSTTPEGITYTYAYDGVGRRVQVIDPRTGTQTTHYDASTGQVDSVSDHEGRTTSYTYYTSNDYKKGMLQTITNPAADAQTAATSMTYDYNTRGQVVSISGDATYNVGIGYDDYGQRTTLETHRDEPAQGQGDITTWGYHAATGLLTSKTYGDNSTVSYTYNIGGLVTKRTWARTRGGGFPLDTTYTYFTRLGQLKKINYSDVTPDVEFTYDRLGQLATVIDGVGTRTFTDDYTLSPVMSRREAITGLYDKTVAFTNWNCVSGTSGEHAEWRITAGPPADIDGDYIADYMSDERGRISRVVGPGLTSAGVKYHYITDSQDPDLALSSLIDRVEYMRPDGQGGEEVAGSSVRSYETHRNLYTGVVNNWGATNVSAYGYANDNMGRRTHNLRSGSAFSQTHFDSYGYNSKSELTGSTRYIGSDPTNPPTENEDDLTYGYAYDGIGNRSTFDVDSVQTTYTSNNLNQYTDTTSPAESFTYDLDGNMTQDGTFDYAWDAENRLKSVTPQSPAAGDQKLVFGYDYRGRRVQKQVLDWDDQTSNWSTSPSLDRRFVWCDWLLLMELDGNNNIVRKYTWGLDMSQTLQGAGGIGGLLACEDANGTPSLTTDDRSYAYFYDANGNVGQLVDTTDPADQYYGTIAAAYEYDPYGNIQVSSGPFADANPFCFSTKYFDAELDYAGTTNDGLYYYGFRHYSPRVGRWMSRDPIGENGGMHIYQFVGNSPLLNHDSMGLCARNCMPPFEGKTNKYDFKTSILRSISAKAPTNEKEVMKGLLDAFDDLDKVGKVTGAGDGGVAGAMGGSPIPGCNPEEIVFDRNIIEGTINAFLTKYGNVQAYYLWIKVEYRSCDACLEDDGKQVTHKGILCYEWRKHAYAVKCFEGTETAYGHGRFGPGGPEPTVEAMRACRARAIEQVRSGKPVAAPGGAKEDSVVLP